MSIIRKFVRDVPIEGLICLDAGTGIGGMTRYLVKRRTKLVYSISNNQEHLDYAHSKCSTDELTNIRFINADMSDLNFLSAETVDVITTHMLINVVTPVKLFSIFRELTWVARKNSLLIIIDYNPLYTYQTDRSHLIEEIFNDFEIHCITIVHNPRGIQGKNFSYTHEYAFFIFNISSLFPVTIFFFMSFSIFCTSTSIFLGTEIFVFFVI